MIQFITHYTESISYLDSAMYALRGGCKWIQLRMKDASDEEVRPVAEALLEECRRHGAVMIIDDRVALAKEIGADGVHLGHDDVSIAEARAMLGGKYIIGGTANTLEDVMRIYEGGGDYVGCGPYRFTTTKKKLSPVLGTDGYRRILGGMKAHGIELPVVAIGGIELDDVAILKNTGVAGIAISGAVIRSASPEETMRNFINAEKRV
ncbi:MAG TPA: thiamine phosphate synthase [Candidatus Avibacteroides excrementipullorum]|nr:thiamine phosphate synthase [Candidatus Avibacteroides excrementipullorum]